MDVVNSKTKKRIVRGATNEPYTEYYHLSMLFAMPFTRTDRSTVYDLAIKRTLKGYLEYKKMFNSPKETTNR